MKSKRFAVFILSNGRPDNVKTMNTLRKQGYTGNVYIICDDLDTTLDQYVKAYGNQVIVFDKKEYAKKTDTMDNFNNMNVVVYARNAVFDIAKKLKLDYFLVLDDDYTGFMKRKEQDGKLIGITFKDLDKVFELSIAFLIDSNALTVAFAQGGDFIGGVGNGMMRKPLKRKAMNSFFCRTDRPFKFIGSINEDTNTYTLEGSKGHLFFTFADVMLTQTQTQSNPGGLTDIYLQRGTYVKSFYTVMAMPSCSKVRMMGSNFSRMHHSVSWSHCVPAIVKERVKKGGG